MTLLHTILSSKGGCRVLVWGMRAEIFWHPPVNFWHLKLYKGVPTMNLQTNKQRTDRWLNYFYISSSQDISLHFTKTLHIFTLIIFKRALIKKIIFKLSLVWPYPYLSSLIWWKYYLGDSKSLQNGKYVHMSLKCHLYT